MQVFVGQCSLRFIWAQCPGDHAPCWHFAGQVSRRGRGVPGTCGCVRERALPLVPGSQPLSHHLLYQAQEVTSFHKPTERQEEKLVVTAKGTSGSLGEAWMESPVTGTSWEWSRGFQFEQQPRNQWEGEGGPWVRAAEQQPGRGLPGAIQATPG